VFSPEAARRGGLDGHRRVRLAILDAMSRPAAIVLAIVASQALVERAPRAETGPFVVFRDSGALAENGFATVSDLNAAVDELYDGYRSTGADLPAVLSVWSTFPFGRSTIQTLYVPLGNDVAGIGLETVYGGDGTFASSIPPMRAMLLHNDWTDLAARAEHHDAPVAGYDTYLFLLELSHLWGPALQVGGDAPGALIGFTFHWSFWLDDGGAPAGGNGWLDNGDGTFTTAAQTPDAVRYSPLDLYAMGLLAPGEVPPFGLLEDVDAPDVADPLNGGTISEVTFPWFSETPVTVTATRREITIDEVIAASGERDPAFGASPTSFELGIALVVGAETTDEELEELARSFARTATALAPAFDTATGGLGELDVITSSELGSADADADSDADVDADADVDVDADADADGDATADAEADADAGGDEEGCGCQAAGSGVRVHRAPSVARLLSILVS
jgi:hypothetical protein